MSIGSGAEKSAPTGKASGANALVVSDPEVMGGAAVFAGTRVPIDVVLGSVAAGVDVLRLQASYPFLTNNQIEAARAYGETRPCVGHPWLQAQFGPAKTRRVVRKG